MKEDNETSFYGELKDFRNALSLALGYEINEGSIESEIKQNINEVFNTLPLITLKGRRQLGLLNSVKKEWECVKHTRYEHSMGVAAKCIIICDYLNSKANNLHVELTIKDVMELALAAALHDCGHLPISHAVERAFLSSGFEKDEVTHEARIIPLLLRPNPYFSDLQKLINNWDIFDEQSIFRVASIISPSKAKFYTAAKKDFIAPKKAVIQLLSSEIDMDRLDYIIRDAENLNYSPITLIKNDIIKLIEGLTLKKTFTIGQKIDNNVELYVSSNFLPNIFYLLVGRVLLYKYCYFSKEVRSFEAILTYLIGFFLKKDISIDPLKLIAMSDDFFIQKYLDELLEDIVDIKERNRTKTKYVNVLKEDKVERFSHQFSINKDDINNPRMREELITNFNKYSFIDAIKQRLIYISKKNDSEVKNHINKNEILFDVFNLKTGGGDLLVKDINEGDDKTLKDFMNGSNMHRLCTETRLDVYYKSDIGDIKKKYINNIIKNFFYYEER